MLPGSLVDGDMAIAVLRGDVRVFRLRLPVEKLNEHIIEARNVFGPPTPRAAEVIGTRVPDVETAWEDSRTLWLDTVNHRRFKCWRKACEESYRENLPHHGSLRKLEALHVCTVFR